jgi:phosphatidylcholine synthase
MDQEIEPQQTEAPAGARIAAFSVHVFTALGAGVALLAMLEAVREHWTAMFWWLGAALIIDGVDGPMARRLDVVRLQPNWSGEVLDLVVDFVTYVFVPAYAITASGLLWPIAAPLLGVGIAVSGALYFADRRMKSDDNHFRGFPGLWNIAAFYLFLPFYVVHPVRVVRLRWLTLSLIGAGTALAIVTLIYDFKPGTTVTVALCAIGLYIAGSDSAIRLVRSLNA